MAHVELPPDLPGADISAGGLSAVDLGAAGTVFRNRSFLGLWSAQLLSQLASNMVLAGHRDINSALFRDLDRLKPGDEIYVYNGLQQEFIYLVKDSYVVTPEHTEVMDPTDDKRVTLITCTPVGLGTQRLIVTAILDEQAGNR